MSDRATAYSLAELAKIVSGLVVGDPTTIVTGVASVDEAEPGDIVFAENSRFLARAARSQAAAALAPAGSTAGEKPVIEVEDPRVAFVALLDAFTLPAPLEPGIHPSAVIGEGCMISDCATVGPLVVMGHGVTVGPRTQIGAACVLGPGCTVGADALLHARVTLYAGSVIGDRSIVHSGSVIGADGFGYIPVGTGLRKVPQLGCVRIGCDVEIGANTTIDRAKTGETLIGDGTKIDNLVHVAHNVKVGPASIIVAQVGIAGSTRIGSGVTIAGQVGIKDHVEVGDGCMVLGGSAVWGSLPAGAVVSGRPARNHRDTLRLEKVIHELPQLARRLKELERQVGLLTGITASADDRGETDGEASE